MKPKYELRPGNIAATELLALGINPEQFGQAGRRTVYLDEISLSEMHGVDWRECKTYDPKPWWPPSFYQWAEEDRIRLRLKQLTPRNIPARHSNLA